MSEHRQDAGADTDEAVSRAIAAVASLPIDQRKVLTVAIATDLTYDRIAQEAGFPPTAVLSWMRSGLHAIAEALDEQSRSGPEGEASR